MPVTIKTPACPVTVNPPPRDMEGDWDIQEDGNNVVATFRDKSGKLQGFALTGDGIKQKMTLQKELPPLLG
jgi:rubredoxin-NAD+ reductase